METTNLLPWIFLTITTSIIPAFLATKLTPLWRRHGDLGEVIGTTVISITALFTVALPLMREGASVSLDLLAIMVGIILALMAHYLFERDGKELTPKMWFVGFTFALHNFPEGIASVRALIQANGANLFTWSLLAHNAFDAVVMTLGLMAMGLKGWRLVMGLFLAAFGEVGGMMVASSNIMGLEFISLVSVGALLGLAIDSAMHWNQRQNLAALTIVALLGITLNSFNVII